MSKSCKDCAFWQMTHEAELGQENRISGELAGFCHRFPPVLHGNWERPDKDPWEGPECDFYYWRHPLTSESDWCGEHQPLPEAIPRALIPEEYRDE